MFSSRSVTDEPNTFNILMDVLPCTALRIDLLPSLLTSRYLSSKCVKLVEHDNYLFNVTQTWDDTFLLLSLFKHNLEIESWTEQDCSNRDKSASFISFSLMSKDFKWVELLIPAHRRLIVPFVMPEFFKNKLIIRFFSTNQLIIVISFSFSAD